MAAPPNQNLHVCIFGVGGYFGGRLAWWLARQADPAWRVHFVARRANLVAIEQSGLQLNTPEAQLVCKPASAAADTRDMPVPDVVLVCVKGHSLDEALGRVAAHCHSETVVIPLLNGADIHERIRARLPKARVLPACVFVGTHLDRPGVVFREGGDGVILLGSDPDHSDFVPMHFLALLDGVGIRYDWFDDPRPAIWEKFVFISAFGLVGAASRKTLGEVLVHAPRLEDVRGIMNEVVDLAVNEGIALDPDVIPATLAKARGFPPETKSSLQRDVEVGGRDEGDLFGGTILRLGERCGVPTPVTERVYARVRSGAGTA